MEVQQVEKGFGAISFPCTTAQASLKNEIEQKKALREHIKREIVSQGTTFTKLEREAAALIRKATHSSKGIVVWCGQGPQLAYEYQITYEVTRKKDGNTKML